MSTLSFTNYYREFKASIRVALPLIATELVYALSGFVAVIMIARLGKVELAANALVWGIYLPVILFFIGILVTVGVMGAQSFGAKDHEGVSICFQQGLILAILFTIPMIIIMWLAPMILPLFKEDPNVIACALPFFHTLMWSMLPLNLLVVIEQFFISIKKNHLVMLISLMIVPIDILFYYLFIFGKLGLPKLGLAGIGDAIAIANGLVSSLFLVYLAVNKHAKSYKLFHKWWIINRKFLLEILRVGLPMGVMFCSELTFFAAVAIMMGIFGTTILAAYQISYQYLMLGLTFLFGLTQTASIRIGNEVGSNNREQLTIALAVILFISFCFMLLFTFFYLFFPHLAVSLDINIHDKDLVALTNNAVLFLRIMTALLLADALYLISLGALRGLKDTKYSLYISLFGFWVIAFPTGYLLAFILHFGGAGILYGIVLGLIVGGLIMFTRALKLIKKADLVALVTKKG